MTKLLSLACIMLLIVLSACGGSPPVQDPYAARQMPVPAIVGTADTLKNSAPILNQQPLPVTQTPGALNPEHGKPGHRCDIAVGAPLSSQAQSAPIQATNQTQALPAMPTLPAQPTVAGMGSLNPEHGKPNHRCDIAVGAPLSTPVQSAPAQSAPVQRPVQTLPSLPQPANTATGTARLNPAHGQPGHDCAIPVGQPLKS